MRILWSWVLLSLFVAVEATADPTYVDVPDIVISGVHSLDLDANGSIDFSLTYHENSFGSRLELLPQVGNLYIVENGTPEWADFTYPAALGNQVWIDPANTYTAILGWLTTYTIDGGRTYGNWSGAEDRFLGLRFKIGDNDHFAWVRLTVEPSGRGIIKDWAYESEPSTAILSGAPTPITSTTWGTLKWRYSVIN